MAESKSLKITKVKSLKRLATKIPQNRDKARSELRDVHAIDTETWHGDIFLIADSDGDYIDTFRRGITMDSVISFLTRPKFESSWNFCYNLTYDASVILKLLEKSILSTYKQKRAFRFKYKKYSFYFIPKKTLRISKGHHSWVYYDIAQFYDFKNLQTAYKNNIGKLPNNYLLMKTKRKEFSPLYYKKNRKTVRQYCVDDCRLTKQLSQHWIDLFGRAFEFYPARWISSGYLAEKVLINHGIDVPFFRDLPYDLQEFAFNSYFGGRFEMLRRGFIGKAYIYDINSAYPYAITQLPDLTNGDWWRTDERILDKSNVGFFKIKVDVDDLTLVAPFPFRKKNRILYPSGKFITHCTLQELQAFGDDSRYTILDSYQFIPRGKKYPFRKFINSLYQKRLELKKQNNPMQLPIKVIINSIYGKTGQIYKNRIGSLFNPVIFSFITGYSRAMLYQFMKKYNLENDIVAFATDSVCTTKKLNVNSDKLGEFSLDAMGNDCYFLQNGFYRINGMWKQRGIGKLGSKEIEHLDTIQRDGKLYYSFKVNRVGRLRNSIITNNISNIGKFKIYEKQINLNADRKRMWIGELDGINDTTNGSVPLSFNHFTLEQI